jgi:hypothetical protein
MGPYRVCIPFSIPNIETASQISQIFFLQVKIIKEGAMSKANISKLMFLMALNSDNILLRNLVE